MASKQDTASAGGTEAGGTLAAEGKTARPSTLGTPKRSTPGKQLLHGADRVVRYYKITETEVDRLAELTSDERAASQRMAFCLGLAVNAAFGLLFGVGLSESAKGAAIALFVLSAIAALGFWFDAKKKREDGKSAFGRIKDDHDFTNV